MENYKNKRLEIAVLGGFKMYYPKECFGINIDHTRQRKKVYEENQARREKIILEHYPDYWDRGLKERYYLEKELIEKGIIS